MRRVIRIPRMLAIDMDAERIEAFRFAEIEAFSMNDHLTGKPMHDDKFIDPAPVSLFNPQNVHGCLP